MSLNCLNTYKIRYNSMHNNLSHFSLKPFISAVFLLFAFSFNVKAQDGAKIFKQNCAVCHALTDQKLTGPGLLGVAGRVPKPEAEWLTKWIKNNNKVIASGDAYAKTLVANNGGTDAMSEFEFLTDDELKALVAYVIAPPVDVTPLTTTTGGNAGEVVEEAKGAIDPLYLLLGSIVLLAIIVGALRSVRHSLANSFNKTEGKPEVPEMTFGQEIKHWMSGHRRLVGVFGIIILFVGMKSCWNACYNLGVYYDYTTQKGYKPEQPIKFSHKIHAGDNEIACQYCHNTVEKSRHAGIPSVNVCMNCHKGIQKGPQYGETEIQKIYDASGFNPKTGTYDKPENPLKWIKVHTLPDHVYFNHSQHVVVGKQECATCHGDLKKMTVAEQKTPLTMKWCIECHRKTEVSMEGNAYYDKIHKALKEKYKGQFGVKFTVESIGGLECAKCHY
jgi:mono/diheme cytochrome c family protein